MSKALTLLIVFTVLQTSCATPQLPHSGKKQKAYESAVSFIPKLLQFGADISSKDIAELNLPAEVDKVNAIENIVWFGISNKYITTKEEQDSVRGFYGRLMFPLRGKLDEDLVRAAIAASPLPSRSDRVQTNRNKRTQALYGVTTSGIYYVHSSLIEEVAGDRPRLRQVEPITDHSDLDMLEKGGYYYRQVDLKGKPFSSDEYILYCFNVGGEDYLPHALKRARSERYSPADIKENNKDGFNFKTRPVPTTPF